jgi:hypothetical protein
MCHLWGVGDVKNSKNNATSTSQVKFIQVCEEMSRTEEQSKKNVLNVETEIQKVPLNINNVYSTNLFDVK